MEDMQKLAPPGSPENAYVRMVTSYWEMVEFVRQRGRPESGTVLRKRREFLFVWERIWPIVPAFREMMKDLLAYHNLEKLANN